jgi:hypothetical protein
LGVIQKVPGFFSFFINIEKTHPMRFFYARRNQKCENASSSFSLIEKSIPPRIEKTSRVVFSKFMKKKAWIL